MVLNLVITYKTFGSSHKIFISGNPLSFPNVIFVHGQSMHKHLIQHFFYFFFTTALIVNYSLSNRSDGHMKKYLDNVINSNQMDKGVQNFQDRHTV